MGPANTRLGAKRFHTVRVRGGNLKFRALRLEKGNFSWGSEGITRQTRLLNVVYNASNNEFVRTKNLLKNSVIEIDSTPFRRWFENHYAIPLGRKKGQEMPDGEEVTKKRSNHQLNQHIDDQFSTGKLYACIASRPGQSGRCDGYVLEGKELDFYLKKIRAK